MIPIGYDHYQPRRTTRYYYLCINCGDEGYTTWPHPVKGVECGCGSAEVLLEERLR